MGGSDRLQQVNTLFHGGAFFLAKSKTPLFYFAMLLEQVKKTIRKHALLEKGDRVLLGVSGGPDSVALLYLLHSLSKELHLRLHIAHIDHMLRKQSAGDARFVVGLSARLKVPVSLHTVDVRSMAGKGSIEEIARNARLEFLCRLAVRLKTDKIALGHTLDDQAETVLMRILRGSGLYGLSAILPKRSIHGVQVIRPLIELRRRDIEAFLRKRRIKPRIDETNFCDIYLRNRIRNHLLPLLEKKYNANIKEVLSGMAETVGYDYDYLSRLAQRKMKKMGSGIELCSFLRLHPSLRRLMLRLAISHIQKDTRRISLQHIREIEDLVRNRPVRSVVDLPKGISVIKKKTRLYFYHR